MTGDPHVDRQHQAFLSELERVRRITRPDDVWPSLAALREYVASHFQSEESLMQRAGYPYEAAHRQAHLAFFDRFVLLKARLERDGATPENRSALVDAVQEWFTSHVLNLDIDMARFVRSKAAR